MTSKGKDKIFGFNIEEGDLLSGFGAANNLNIKDRGRSCMVSGNGYKRQLKGIDAVDLIEAMEIVFA